MSESIAQLFNDVPCREGNEQIKEDVTTSTAHVPSSHLRSHSHSG